MKHLKKYNESVEEISLEDIRDICLELEDNDFNITIMNNTKDIYTITIGKSEFTYKDVKEVLLRLKDYLREDLLNTIVNPVSIRYWRFINCEFDENSLRGRRINDRAVDTHLCIKENINNIPLFSIKIIFIKK